MNRTNSFLFSETLHNAIRSNVDKFEQQTIPGAAAKHAAVAITVVTGENGEDAALLLTRRASKMRAHPGQWALPGGRIDEGEVPVEAALRELGEEVGLHRTTEHVVGVLDDYVTRNGYRITPVVVWGGSSESLQADPTEVASIHLIPLAEFAAESSIELVTIDESERPVIRLHFLDQMVHAPTAALIHQFIEVGLFARNTRVHEYEQPLWLWPGKEHLAPNRNP